MKMEYPFLTQDLPDIGPAGYPSDEWVDVEGAFEIENGVHPLYLRFLGEGRIDLSSLSFRQRQ